MNTFFEPDDDLRQLDEYLYFTKRQIDRLFELGVPAWDIRQEGELERITQGILNLNIKTTEDVKAFCAKVHQKHGGNYTYERIFNYSAHRWINTQSSRAFERIIICHPRITAESNKRNPDTDFWVDEAIPLDLKVTKWPGDWEYQRASRTEQRLKQCLNDPTGLINWMYTRQGPARWNWQNRLFIVCYDDHEKKHLLLKSDFSQMKGIIFNYFDKFDSARLIKVDQLALNGFIRTHNAYGRETQPVALADVIWNYKEHTLDYTPRLQVLPFNGGQLALW